MNFTVTADERVKLKESEKKDKYLDLAREQRKLWKMKVAVTLIVIETFETVSKGFERGLEELEIGGWIGDFQTIDLLKSTRILKKVLETWEDLRSVRYTTSWSQCWKLARSKIIICLAKRKKNWWRWIYSLNFQTP